MEIFIFDNFDIKGSPLWKKKSKISKNQFFFKKLYFFFLNLYSTCSKLSFQVYNSHVSENFEQTLCYVPQKKAQNIQNSDSSRKSMIFLEKTQIFTFLIFFSKGGTLWCRNGKIFFFNFSKFHNSFFKNSFIGTKQILK